MPTPLEALLIDIRSGERGEADFARFRGWKRDPGHGFDAWYKGYPAEVRTRLLGTDNGHRGPRITLTALKVKTSALLAWAHYDQMGRLVRAWIVPMASIKPLYDQYKQRGTGKAHIDWRLLTKCRGAKEVTHLLAA